MRVIFFGERHHFNPRPPWGGRHLIQMLLLLMTNFNPRPPWGGRPAGETAHEYISKFQSTPSVGRATLFLACFSHGEGISIHALRGEGDLYFCYYWQIYSISIHALRGEGDGLGPASRNVIRSFQSTPSVGRATSYRMAICTSGQDYFNPRPPWGGRL